MKMSQCKGCGKEIVWALTEEGKKIPMDLKPVIYQMVELDNGEARVKKLPGYPVHCVSHFVTCPKANDFSGRARAALEEK